MSRAGVGRFSFWIARVSVVVQPVEVTKRPEGHALMDAVLDGLEGDDENDGCVQTDKASKAYACAVFPGWTALDLQNARARQRLTCDDAGTLEALRLG